MTHTIRNKIAATITFLMMLQLILPMFAHANTARITIDNLYKNTNFDKNLPADDRFVQRFTSSPIRLEATIENIDEADIPNIYYEIINMNTKTSVIEKTRKPTKVNAFKIVFEKVDLTEGLNRIVIKLGETSVISSTPGWAYFTPAASIESMKITDQTRTDSNKTVDFDETKIFPEDSSKGSILTISGDAPNADEMFIYPYNSTTPIIPFFKSGVFTVTADDIKKKNPNANFSLRSGENPITFVSKNATKSYKVTKNLIYDDGKPFAYNSTLGERFSETVATTKFVNLKYTLPYSDIDPRSIEIYRDADKKDKYVQEKDYFLDIAQEVTDNDESKNSTTIRFAANFPSAVKTLYIYYQTRRPISKMPTMVSNVLNLKANIKSDLDQLGEFKYKYMDLLLNGQVKGTYQLTNAKKAPVIRTEIEYAPSPTQLLEGYSDISLQFFGNNLYSLANQTDPTKKLSLRFQNRFGVDPFEDNAEFTGDAVIHRLTDIKDVAIFNLPSGLTASDGPFNVFVSLGDILLHEEQMQVVKPLAGELPKITADELTAADSENLFKEGQIPDEHTISFDQNLAGASLTLEWIDLANITLNPTPIVGVNLGDKASFKLKSDMPEGYYRYVIKRNNDILTERYFIIQEADPLMPTASAITQPSKVISANSPTYFLVRGANFPTKKSDIVTPMLVADGENDVPVDVYSTSSAIMVYRINDPSKLTAGQTYNFTAKMRVRDKRGELFQVDPDAATPEEQYRYTLTANNVVEVLDPTTTDDYNGEIVTSIGPLQLSKDQVATQKLTMKTNASISDETLVHVKVINETDGVQIGIATVAKTDNPNEYTLALPAGMEARNFLLDVSYGDDTPPDDTTTVTLPTVALYPFSVALPGQFSISPNTNSSTELKEAPKTMTFFGSSLGRDESKLKIQFKPSVTNVNSKLNTGITISFSNNDSGFKVSSSTPKDKKGKDPTNVAKQLVVKTGWANGNTIELGGVTFTAQTTADESGATTDGTNFDIGTGSTPSFIAAQIKKSIETNPTLSGANGYVVTANPAGTTLTITPKVANKTDWSMPITAAAAAYELTNAISGGAKEKTYLVVSGKATEQTSFHLTVTGGTLSEGLSTKEIQILKTDTANDVATKMKDALYDIETDLGFIVLDAESSNNTIVLEQSFPKTLTVPLEFSINGGGSIENSSQISFPIPALAEGSYDVQLLYEDTAVGQAVKYQVTSNLIRMDENMILGKNGRYKVLDFETDLEQIPLNKLQTLNFEFYNTKGDATNPVTTYYFYYKDPASPYVEKIHKLLGGQEVALNESTQNVFNEQPIDIYVYTNRNAEKVNLYYNTFSVNTLPVTYQLKDLSYSNPTANRFKFRLNGLKNGEMKLIFVPSTSKLAQLKKDNENPEGKMELNVKISSTPYVIMNNIYTGMVIKNDPKQDLNCTNFKTGTVQLNCISGRFVNVADEELLNVDVRINGQTKIRMKDDNFEVESTVTNKKTGKFNLILGSEGAFRFPDLTPNSQNVIEFIINNQGVPVTTAKFEIFVVSSDLPIFNSLKPVEVNEQVPRFIKDTKIADTYTTAERKVTLKGSFANAEEITLTVVTIGDDGLPREEYERRYTKSLLNKFGETDPKVNPPNYFVQLNPNTGEFTTKPITLQKTGKTVFRFTIMNSKNVNVNKSIIITRNAPDYVFVYPKMLRNATGQNQANINSNFVEVVLESEVADQFLFDKTKEATKTQYTNDDGQVINRFTYELSNLKNGKNDIKFIVQKGDTKQNASFILYNVNTVVEGAMFKTAMKDKISVFNNEVNLSFPKGTTLMKNDPTAPNQYITAERRILFGLADPADGRLEKTKPEYENSFFEGADLLQEPTGRFRSASNLVWVDAGTIDPTNEKEVDTAIAGSGRNPYDGVRFYAREDEDLIVPSQRGTISLKYDPNLKGDSWRYLSVFHYDKFEDENGVVQYKWRNIGGIVDTSKKTITAPLTKFGYYQVKYMEKSFDDVIEHPWARLFLDTMYSKGYLKNKELTSFGSNDPMTRGEFVTMLVKVYDIPLTFSDQPTFSDVQRVNPLNGLYDYKYIETAAYAGIVRGGSGGRFLPDKAVTRQEAATMIAKITDAKLNSAEDKVLANLQKIFTDSNLINNYAQASVEAVAKAGIIDGRPNETGDAKKPTFRFDPTDVFTRAEASKVGYKLLQNLKKIPK